jgi:ribosome-associated protein
MGEYEVILPDLSAEFQFATSRSSGPGGQNVNKVNSKVELRFDIAHSEILTTEQKEILLQKLTSKITSDGILSVVSQRDRSQLANKEDVISKFYTLLARALKPQKPRKKTKPSKSSVEKRLTSKRIKAEIKQSRQKFSE